MQIKTFLRGAVLTAVAVLLTVAQTHDTTAPTLTALTIAPTTVDASAGPVDVTITFTASDSLSGVADINFTFASGGYHMAAGSLDSSGSVVLTVPRYKPAGAYSLRVTIIDKVGNLVELGTAELTAAGFPTAITVQ